MNIAVVGIDLPLGKRDLADERLDKLKGIFHPSQVTPIQIEFCDLACLSHAYGIICEENAKLDLILSDLEIIDRCINSDKNKDLALRCKEALEKEIFLNEVPFNVEEKKILLNLNLSTTKPVYFVDKNNLAPIPELMRNAYTALGMISFFTVNERQLRAWSLSVGTVVLEAAGCIHSDLKKGFIRAEVIAYEELIKSGGLNPAKAKGLVKLVDKEYIVRDGDLVQIRFNV